MKVLILATLLLLFIPQKTSPITRDPVNLAIAAGALVTATWLGGEILKDCGHRYLHCKKVAVAYADELKKYDKQELLTDNELLAWSTVQGISAIPEKCWRELTALGMEAALLYIAFIHLTAA
jgi:hypothetical protein